MPRSHLERRRFPGIALALVSAVLAVLVTPVTATAATRSVNTAGADRGACTTTPCATFAYAYRQAAPGDVVEVGTGTYPEQAIPAIGGRAAPAVDFRPASGAAVTLRDIRVQGDHVTLRGMRLGYAWIDRSGGSVTGVTVVDGSGPGMYIGNVRDLLVEGGSYGSVVNTPVITIGGALPGLRRKPLVHSELFEVDLIGFPPQSSLDIEGGQPRILAVVDGAVQLTADNGSLRLGPGQFGLLPAALSQSKLSNSAPATLLEITL